MANPTQNGSAHAQAVGGATEADTSAPEDADATLPASVDWDSADEGNPYSPDNGFDEAFAALEAAEQARAGDAASGEAASGEAETEGRSGAESQAAEAGAETADTGEDLADPDAAETAGEAAGDESAEATEGIDFSALSSQLGTHVKGAEQLVEHVQGLQERADGLAHLEQLVTTNEAFGKFTAALVEGKSPEEAALGAIDGLTRQAPDPDVDPDGYADFRADRARQEERAKFQEQSAQEQQRTQQRGAKAVERAFNAFSERMDGASEGFDKQAFAQQYLSLTQIDPQTGRFRPDAFEVIHKGLHHDRLVKEAVEAARKEGITKGVRKVRDTQQDLQAPPNLTSSRREMAGAEASGEEAQKMRRFAQETLSGSNWWDEIPEN